MKAIPVQHRLGPIFGHHLLNGARIECGLIPSSVDHVSDGQVLESVISWSI